MFSLRNRAGATVLDTFGSMLGDTAPKPGPNITESGQIALFAVFSDCWEAFGSSWGYAGVSWGPWGVSWRSFGGSWGGLGVPWGFLGAPWGTLGAARGLLGAFWGPLGPLGTPLGPPGEPLGPLWGPLGSHGTALRAQPSKMGTQIREEKCKNTKSEKTRFPRRKSTTSSVFK